MSLPLGPDVLLGRLPREQLRERHEPGVAWRQGVGLRTPADRALCAARFGRVVAVVGALGWRNWEVVRQGDHPRARRRVIV
jgi:hypothetical protein